MDDSSRKIADELQNNLASLRTLLGGLQAESHREEGRRHEMAEEIKQLQLENAYLMADLLAIEAEREASEDLAAAAAMEHRTNEDREVDTVVGALKALKASQDKEVNTVTTLRGLESRVERLRLSTAEMLNEKDEALRVAENTNKNLQREMADMEGALQSRNHVIHNMEKRLAEERAAREAGANASSWFGLR